MRYALLAAALTITPAAAQNPFGEAHACVMANVDRYVAIEAASLSDVADAAMAACETKFDDLRPPTVKLSRPDDFWEGFDRWLARARADALAKAADLRLEAQR